MATRRARVLIGSILATATATSLLVQPVAAACGLSAPASVAIGAALVIEGAGFPARTTVEVTTNIQGGRSDAFTIESDAAGTFTISLTPEAADRGLTTIVASAGAGCRAQVVVGVGVPGPAPAPQATASPAVTGGTAGEEGSAPRTDGVPAQRPGGPHLAWIFAAVLLALGTAGRLATRPSRRP